MTNVIPVPIIILLHILSSTFSLIPSAQAAKRKHVGLSSLSSRHLFRKFWRLTSSRWSCWHMGCLKGHLLVYRWWPSCCRIKMMVRKGLWCLLVLPKYTYSNVSLHPHAFIEIYLSPKSIAFYCYHTGG